jgi:SAM-dependent methyltransferase
MTCSPTAWTPEHVRHVGEMFRQGRNPAARVYESIGPDFFLAPAPGWLNLGLWEGDGSVDEAEAAGRCWLKEASAAPVVGDAARLPIADGTADGIISVEAAFHFSSRRAFFEQCYRVLRPGGVVTMSDISTAHVIAARALLRQVGLLWRRHLIDYVLLRAVRP